jgi:aspartyl/glutamyl-tRNA(Asn/Gln) amidotransferase C subunit
MHKETPVETVERLARLARISIPEDKKESLAAEFESVLAYIAQLDELNIEVGSTPRVPPLHNVFRKDGEPNERGEYTEAIIAAFPAKDGTSLSVKKIISHG